MVPQGSNYGLTNLIDTVVILYGYGGLVVSRKLRSFGGYPVKMSQSNSPVF